ncbi:MAG: isoleucyl-tRNA synthetase [Candidatus Methanoperedens nitroreducens]|uniref:Isoleucine--tRNA ligase n=1 Tax=Candidatus Methanoperedens nitratireducens TaxID=1392998 RepID=A0A0P8A9T5_9EURY|nr:isoleucine--tRNA ligase [Candidatus Methanoperedens sp. BLZ2]KAB2947825.1 MAG: isoleucine--tRNA ligase [Candidatus Methanoperedens sp.]KPQ45088.1 MAG: isoleucyl-tRNA synthetase [Candidatus Methanoperedens sp. BLZ1]MBZ0175230.1 isoleucine--tRNA ligase [Candidatus Methanoperedens nitroreducens]MCX9076502.1 isoleucine--tRNA ligase [Candidatus Methanoperedens sp.]
MLKEAGQYDAKSLEQKIHKLWEEIDAYSRVREQRVDGKKFFFVDGPPYTTGRIHLGTAWNKIIKDSILRYKSMNGFHVLDRAGWDMHGLPIEVKVEGVLGFKSKKDIEKYGVGNFVAKCKEFALSHRDEMTLQFQNLGVWLNWKDPYMTLRDEYIEAAWWTLKKAHEKNLLERGLRVVNWCPRCETAIADSEVEYSDVSDPSVYIKFPVADEENTFIVIWTTTPWTIPANIAVAVHPSFEYVKVRAVRNEKEEILIMAKELLKNVLKQGRYKKSEILETILGEDLKIEYKAPLGHKVPKQNTFPHNVYMADFVTAENTGCVHIAPGHGIDDFELGMKYKLPIFCPVGPDGKYTAEAGEYKGMHVREANKVVLDDLSEKDLLLASGKILHRYGHCWRCKTPIIYLATEQWFLKVTDLKEKMLEEIKKVKWYPDWAGSARFADWVKGSRDWCISRQRYWGIPIPVWICDFCGETEVMGTMEELKNRSGVKNLTDLHRPYVDNIHIKCSKCEKRMTRVPDVFDVWFDSAVASWATLNFPRDEKTYKEWWPADFITEGHDQTRGWFYSQMGASMVSFGKAPYKSVLMHGFTLDTEGKKMSKSLGNVVSPDDVINKYGAESLRLYVLSQNAPWDDLKFIWEEVGTINRMLNILWNVYRFPLPYMILDNFNPVDVKERLAALPLRVEDKWILSRVQSLIKKVETAMSEYNLHKATRPISEFILEDLSRWYIQLIRPRTWTEANDPDKLAAYYTLYEVLVTLTKVLAPFAPHISEEMYGNLVRNIHPDAPESVHMCDWQGPDEKFIDIELEKRMDIIREIVEASSNARQKLKRKLRWPVKRIVVAPKNEIVNEAVLSLETVLKEQTNAKEIVLLKTGETFDELGVEVLPNHAVLGPAFKKDAGKVIAELKTADGRAIKKSILETGSFELKAGTITADMVTFKDLIPPAIAAAGFSAGDVYVDTELTREIESEGYSREVIRRIQDMRKELDLAVEEEIRANVEIKDERVAVLVLEMKNFIAGEVRAKSLSIGPEVEVEGELVKDWDVEDVKMRIGIGRRK